MAGGDFVAQFGLNEGSNLSDLGEGDVIVVVASDLEEEAPIWYLRVKAAAERGAKLITVNPRPTKLDRYASEKIRYTYGDEVTAVQGVGLSEAENVVVFYGSEGLGLNGSAALAHACANLITKTGKVGHANNGLVAVWNKANEQGAWDLGLRPILDLESAIRAAKVVYFIAADPAGDDNVIKDILKARFERPEALTIVQDIFLSETSQWADIILPAQAHTEREGTFTSGERRVQRFYPVTRPKGESKADFDIASMIGARVGVELKGRFPSLVFPQIAAEIPGYGRLTYQKLAEVIEQWPIMGRGDLYYGGTGYENKQGLGVQLAPLGGDISHLDTPVSIPAGQLVAVPITTLYDRGTMVVPSKILHAHLPDPYIILNSADAETQMATEGMTVNVSVGEVSAPVVVKIDEDVPAGFALVPRSFGIPVTKPIEITIQVAKIVAA